MMVPESQRPPRWVGEGVGKNSSIFIKINFAFMRII
jgi:hypothetical protein